MSAVLVIIMLLYIRERAENVLKLDCVAVYGVLIHVVSVVHCPANLKQGARLITTRI